MFETLIFVGVVLLTQVVKGYVYPKWGNTGVHVLTFAISLVGLGIYQYAVANPSFMELLVDALQFLAGAIALYEVILKKIGFNSAPEIARDLR